MLVTGNGQPVPTPVLGIAWNEGAKDVQLVFDPQQFPTWEFVLGLLEMARHKAQEGLNMARMQKLQQMAQDQALAAQLSQKRRP